MTLEGEQFQARHEKKVNSRDPELPYLFEETKIVGPTSPKSLDPRANLKISRTEDEAASLNC